MDHNMKSDYQILENEYKLIFSILKKDLEPNPKSLKRFHEIAHKYKHPQLLIKMLNNQDYTEDIKKIVNP